MLEDFQVRANLVLPLLQREKLWGLFMDEYPKKERDISMLAPLSTGEVRNRVSSVNPCHPASRGEWPFAPARNPVSCPHQQPLNLERLETGFL